jgi:hypothetical protein
MAVHSGDGACNTAVGREIFPPSVRSAPAEPLSRGHRENGGIAAAAIASFAKMRYVAIHEMAGFQKQARETGCGDCL